MDKEIIKNKLQALLNHYNAGNYQYTAKESEILLKEKMFRNNGGKFLIPVPNPIIK